MQSKFQNSYKICSFFVWRVEPGPNRTRCSGLGRSRSGSALSTGPDRSLISKISGSSVQPGRSGSGPMHTPNSVSHFPLIPSPRNQFSASRHRFRCSSSSMDSGKVKFMEYPYASGPTKKLMVELLSTVDEHLGSSLQPTCTLAPNVQHFGNSTDTAHASLHLRSGLPSSQLPSGGALNITSLSAYLTSSTDAPHFLLELIQSSPTSLVLILDLTPRKDLILYPEYLKDYYEDTQLDRHRQRLQALPEVRPYFSPSLYIRAVVSPTAILVTIDTGASESKSIEQIIEDDISPIAKELLYFWIESCARRVRDMEESGRAYIAKRDQIIKRKTIEVDLGSSFPRLFGQEVADRVLNALNEYYK